MNEKLTSEQIVCDWNREQKDSEVWTTSCNQIFCLNDGATPWQNGMKYCCFCGKPFTLTANTAVDEVVEIVGMNGNAMEFHLSDQVRKQIILQKIEGFRKAMKSDLTIKDCISHFEYWLQNEN